MENGIECNDRVGRFCVSGVEVLRVRITLPCRAELSDFYRGVAQRVWAYCEGTLRLRAEEAYEASEEPNKRFAFPTFLYRLEGRICHEEAGLLSVRLEGSLGRRGMREPEVRWADAHTWLTEGGKTYLLPPEQAVARFGGGTLSRRERKRCRGAILSEGRVFLCDGKDFRIFTPKISKTKQSAQKNE